MTSNFEPRAARGGWPQNPVVPITRTPPRAWRPPGRRCMQLGPGVALGKAGLSAVRKVRKRVERMAFRQMRKRKCHQRRTAEIFRQRVRGLVSSSSDQEHMLIMVVLVLLVVVRHRRCLVLLGLVHAPPQHARILPDLHHGLSDLLDLPEDLPLILRVRMVLFIPMCLKVNQVRCNR